MYAANRKGFFLPSKSRQAPLKIVFEDYFCLVERGVGSSGTTNQINAVISLYDDKAVAPVVRTCPMSIALRLLPPN